MVLGNLNLKENVMSHHSMSPVTKFMFKYLFPWPFVIAGGSLLYSGVSELMLARASEGWPTADGVIVNSGVEYHDSDEGSGTYHAEVSYDYKVDGVEMDNDVVAYGEYGSSNSGHAKGIVSRYPEGKVVKVYYKPDEVAESVLEPGVSGQAYLMPAGGLIFFSLGVVLVFVLPKQIEKEH